MSHPSNWPLPPEGIRFALPDKLLQKLATHPLSQDLHPRLFGYYPRARGHRMERSQHDDYLLIYCVAGAGQVQLLTPAGKAAPQPIGPGDLILLPPGVAHRYAAQADNPWSIYWMHFNGSLAATYAAHLLQDQDAICLHPGLLPRLLAAFHDLLATRLSAVRMPTCIHQSLQLKSLLTYCALQARHPDSHTQAGFDLDALHTLMQHRIRESLSLDQLAAAAGLSRHHFARSYKKVTGETPVQHFLKLKMQHACFLLEVSNQSIQQIAAELGYEDAYYFSRLFKKLMGVAPQHYRLQDSRLQDSRLQDSRRLQDERRA